MITLGGHEPTYHLGHYQLAFLLQGGVRELLQ